MALCSSIGMLPCAYALLKWNLLIGVVSFHLLWVVVLSELKNIELLHIFPFKCKLNWLSLDERLFPILCCFSLDGYSYLCCCLQKQCLLSLYFCCRDHLYGSLKNLRLVVEFFEFFLFGTFLLLIIKFSREF